MGAQREEGRGELIGCVDGAATGTAGGDGGDSWGASFGHGTGGGMSGVPARRDGGGGVDALDWKKGVELTGAFNCSTVRGRSVEDPRRAA